MSERELTYCDADAELPFAEEDEPTAADAARFLEHLWERSPGRLRLREAVERFVEEFGGRFLVGTPGHAGIDREVLERFRRSVGEDVLWDAGDRCWRWRQQGERSA